MGTTGGRGGGDRGGAAGPGTTGYCNAAQAGKDGGYLDAGKNGDNTTDASVVMGSGGGGGGASSARGGGGGGGGAGGGAVTLVSEGGLTIAGLVGTTGAGGGRGGTSGTSISPDDRARGPQPVQQNTGGPGGGGAGGGIALVGLSVVITGNLDARGRQADALTNTNGGTIKIFYTELEQTGTLQYGRLYRNGRPAMGGLASPADNAVLNATPELAWNAAADPERETPEYQVVVATADDFADPVVDREGVTETLYRTSLVDGEYFWKVRARDAFGYGAWSEARRFTLDTVAPESSVLALPEFTTSTPFRVTWSATDGLAGVSNCTVYMSDNGGGFAPWLERTTKTFADLDGKEGRSYRFYCVAADRAGNVEAAPEEADAGTTLDTVAPSSSLTALPPYSTTASIDIAWSGKDAVSGIAGYTVMVSDNGGEFRAWQDGVTERSAVFTAQDGHEYRFCVRAVDRAGNLEPEPGPEKHIGTRVDLSAPATRLAVGDPQHGTDPVYITPGSTLTLAAKDGYSGLDRTWYRLDGSEAREYTAPLKNLPSGPHVVAYWSTDLAGNAEPEASIRVFVDGEAPFTTVSIEGANFTRGTVIYITDQTLISLSARDNGSGVRTTEFSVDGLGYSTFESPFTVKRAGAHTVTYLSIDRLGQKEVERRLSLFVDVTPPSTVSSEREDEGGAALVVMLKTSDEQSGVAATYYRVLRDGEVVLDWTSGTEAVLEKPQDHSGDGSYRVEYYGVDNLGNREGTGSREVLIDTVSVLVSAQKESSTVSSARFTFTGQAEPGSRVTVNGMSVPVSRDGNFSVELVLKEGPNTITVVATDRAGNEAVQVYKVTYNRPAESVGPLLPLLGLAVVVIAAAVGGVVFARRRGRPAPPAAPAEKTLPKTEPLEPAPPPAPDDPAAGKGAPDEEE
ncbi:MAG: cadherin-like beta sandwich domain-containing protein [Euryarchaeota archaeon]|nr:cadherin-like beta sandwich domain-containing protein [Euryarchaeota archaeon]